MKRLFAIAVALLAGCLSIPDNAVNALANAGGGCFKANGFGYSVEFQVANQDKGSIRNGGVTVAGGCGGIQILDQATIRAAIRESGGTPVPVIPQVNHGFTLTPLPPGPVLFNPTPVPMKPVPSTVDKP